MNFLKFFDFFSDYVSGRQFIVVAMSVCATLLETMGFLTLIPVLSFVDEKNIDSDSDVANTIIFLFETVGISPSLLNILMIFVIIFALKGLILFLMLRYLDFTRAILLMGLRQKIFSAFAASTVLNSRSITMVIK